LNFTVKYIYFWFKNNIGLINVSMKFDLEEVCEFFDKKAGRIITS